MFYNKKHNSQPTWTYVPIFNDRYGVFPMPENEIEKMKHEIMQNGYFAKIRSLHHANSLAVGHKPKISAEGKIEMIRRMFYLAQKDNGSWYTLVGGIDADENYDYEQAKHYTLKVLAMSNEQYLQEVTRRLSSAQNQHHL